MEFWKMNGAGNDFLFLNNFAEQLEPAALPGLAVKLCERRLGIGADGLMVIDRPDADADVKMRFYNCDGTIGEMCGNGARCVCRYAYENGFSGSLQKIETVAGLVTGERITESQYRIRLNDPSVLKTEYPVELDGKVWDCAYVELGNPGIPHAAVYYPGLRSCDEAALRLLGSRLRSHPAFPKGANVNFYDILPDGSIWEKTFERGVEDFTYACGTGTGSVAVVLTVKGLRDGRQIAVDMKGGRLIIDYDGKDLMLTGPTEIVCKGTVTF